MIAFSNKPHIPSPEDRTALTCKACGYRTHAMSRSELQDMGLPWYCNRCNARMTSFKTMGPSDPGFPEFCNQVCGDQGDD